MVVELTSIKITIGQAQYILYLCNDEMSRPQDLDNIIIQLFTEHEISRKFDLTWF